MSVNPLDTVDKALAFADDAFESGEEREATRTERLKLDTTSPFKLPHLIRPISFIWAMANETILTWATIFVVFFAGDVDPEASTALMAALAANTAVLSTIVGFYFNGRSSEKKAAKKAAADALIMKTKTKAAVQLELIKTRAQRKADKKKERHERQQERRNPVD